MLDWREGREVSIVELQEVVFSGSLDSGEFTVRISERGMEHLVALAVAEKLGISIDDVWNAGKIAFGEFGDDDGHQDSARVRFALKRGQTSERAASWLGAYRGAKKVACEVIEEGRRETTSVVVPLPSGLEVSDAGVAHNDAVLALLRDLEPGEGDKAALEAKREATRVNWTKASSPGGPLKFGGTPLPIEARTVFMPFDTPGFEVSMSIDVAKRMVSLYTDPHFDPPDAYELRCGKRLFDAILANPEVARAPYDKARFCQFSGNLSLLGDGDVEVIEGIGMRDDQGVFAAMRHGKKIASLNIAGTFEAGAPVEAETREAEPAVDPAIHTRDWRR